LSDTAQTLEVCESGQDAVPSWSGKLEVLPSGLGVFMVHVDDWRTHRLPAGWHPTAADPIYTDVAEVWVLSHE